MIVSRLTFLAAVGFCALAAGPAAADTFNITSCGLTGGCGTATQLGTVTLTQSGTSVLFDVVLNSGNRFVETGAGGGELFLFNDGVSGSSITNITATLNEATVSITGGLSGFTNISPPVNITAGSEGTFSASVECTIPMGSGSPCNGGSTPNINDLEFTVSNATIAQLDKANANGNIFVADILCGQTGCPAGGPTGVVDVNTPAVPLPSAFLLFGTVLAGGLSVSNWRKRRLRGPVSIMA